MDIMVEVERLADKVAAILKDLEAAKAIAQSLPSTKKLAATAAAAKRTADSLERIDKHQASIEAREARKAEC